MTGDYRPRFEYHVADYTTHSGGIGSLTETVLNRLGAEGWELVGLAPVAQGNHGTDSGVTDAFRAVFKRAIPIIPPYFGPG